jgi:integrase
VEHGRDRRGTLHLWRSEEYLVLGLGISLTALWALAIYTGCRQGELLALSWTDVDLERATLSIRRNLIQIKNQTPIFGSPKSETSRRTIS